MNGSSDELQCLLRDALERADRLQEALIRRERQIRALRRVSQALALQDGEKLIGQALDVALETLRARAGAILLYDAPDDTLLFRYVLGPSAQSLTGAKMPASQGVAGQVLRTGAPEVTRHAAQVEGFHLLPSEHASSDDAMITVPLKRAAGDAVGVMQLVRSGDEGEFDEGDGEIVQVLGAAVASALETARLTGQAHRAEIVSIIGDISHDIKNMLTPIQSGLWTLEPLLDHLFETLETVREQSRGRAVQSDIARSMELVQGDYGWILKAAHDACDQVTARTREIADAVKGELAAPVFEEADLNEVVGEVARPLFMLAERTNVHLHFELDRDLPRAEFDRKQIYNALYNLVNNAIPETPSGGSVTIRTRAPQNGEDTLLLEVEDTGRGVPEHVRARLFTDQAVSTKAGGTGLGTRIVGGVVQRHQGRIEVKSEMGVGSTFSIHLPLRHRPEPVSLAPESGPLPVRRHNLPAATTSFVGRETELARVRELLGQGATRLITLTGAAGAGKTRLALQVAAEVVGDYQDGVWFVSLASLDGAERVVPAIAATLGVREQPGHDIGGSLSDFLRSKHLLLLVDNFERVLGAAPKLSGLLEACEGLKILATSRAALRLRGEREVMVPPLDVPALSALSPLPSEAQVRELAQSAAVALFVERAAQARPDFVLCAENARDVALICARLDGLPLAIELAAARAKILSPSALRSHLENQFPLPGSGPQDAPLRHQTLRAAIDWSYDLLAPAQQALFRRLMVFEGGCSPEAARAVIADELGLEVRDALERLCDNSLLRHAPQSDGSMWFCALETLRQYGREKLEQSGELEALQARHAAYYLGLTEAALALLLKDPDAPPAPPGLPSAEASQALWREWREREHLNLRAALNWFLEHAGEQPRPEVPSHGALRMAFALRRVWMGDLWTERREALERALKASPDAPDEMRLSGMMFAGDLAALQADTKRAAEIGRQLLDLSQKVGSRWSQARALGLLANVALENGDFAQARALHEQSLAIHREMDNAASMSWSLYFLGTVAKRSGDEAASRDYFAQSLELFRETEDTEGIATALYQLSMAQYRRDDPAPSRALLEESLAIFRELGHQSGTAWTMAFLGRMAADEGHFELARERLEQSLDISRRLGSRTDVRATLSSLSDIALEEGDWERARVVLRELLAFGADSPPRELLGGFARLAAALCQMERAARLLGAMGETDSPISDQARVALGDAVFDAAFAHGATLTPKQLAQEALAI